MDKRVLEGVVQLFDNCSYELFGVRESPDYWHPYRIITEDLAGKRIRLTIEVIDDDHLEMEKLERE